MIIKYLSYSTGNDGREYEIFPFFRFFRVHAFFPQKEHAQPLAKTRKRQVFQ